MAVGQNAVGTDLYQWDNVPKAVVEGLEGSLNVPVSETVMWTNNITYMLKSENKTTGDRLSIIPEYTLNSTLSWQAREDLSMQTTFTWYGKQQPKKYNYKGQPAVGPETKEISPYSIVGLSATWDVTKNVSLTGGVDNLFDNVCGVRVMPRPRAIWQGPTISPVPGRIPITSRDVRGI